MSDRGTIPFGPWSGMAEVHRNTYRIFCVIAGVLSPVFGVIYRFTNPEAIDPLWARFALAVVSLLLLSLSYMQRWVQDNFIGLVHGYFYLLSAFYVGLTSLNSFSPNYTLGLLFVITGVGVAFSLGLKQTEPLTRYLAFSVLLILPAVFLVPEPEVSVAIVSVCAFSTALVIYVAADSKIRAEESIEASEKRYHTLMNAANDAIFIADPDSGMLIDANRKAQELVGRSLDEIRRMRPSELFPLEQRDRYVALFEAHVFGEEPIVEDLFVANRSGHCIPVDINASLIDVEGKKLIQGIFRDATERHRYEEQLIQAKDRAEELLRLKTSLLNNMSHELRTPLTSILGYAEILSEEAGETQQEFAQVIITSAKRLYETVNSILGLAQLESGAATLDPKTLDLSVCVNEAVSLLRPLANQKGIKLRTVVLTREAYARVDEVCLNRIINNLVGNAIKFTEKGQVRVEIDGDADHVHLRVEDTGIGISPSFLPHLFDEFRQESTGLARSHEGNGLGLAITKRLVTLMNGTIEVESEKEKGSVFTVTFPRVQTVDGTAAPQPPPSAAVDSPPTRRRILMAEDNPNTRKLVQHRLSGLYHVEVAADPKTALELAASSTFDAFLLDINLGAPQDGIDVLRLLRKMPGYEHTPSVALTAYAMPGDQERFLEAGFDYYLSKPFTKEQLLQVVQQLFPQETTQGDGLSEESQLAYRRS